MSNTEKLTAESLRQFTGSENWYRHGLVRDVLYSDGVKYLAETAGAYWLIDEIAIAQRHCAKVSRQEFQLWRLIVNADDSTAILACEDGNGKAVHRKQIPFTDFPLPEIALYVVNNVIHLPSEY